MPEGAQAPVFGLLAIANPRCSCENNYMPLFSLGPKLVKRLNLSRFRSEKELQALVEKNLDVMFGARFVATEFSTGAKHAGRIDSLALDENDNPVIIEYKAVESSDLVNQSLFYLSWIDDHREDFELAARKKLRDIGYAGRLTMSVVGGSPKGVLLWRFGAARARIFSSLAEDCFFLKVSQCYMKEPVVTPSLEQCSDGIGGWS